MIKLIKSLFKKKEYPVDIDIWDIELDYVIGDVIQD